ncbi:hypothetical protein PHLCEN_2v8160 [Hermanssonia centrifuga]|uniref:Uncharacterized protein n=1 Tax=Hermanssonia centrifuga TaxID=98765 RepID=A0A2R6NUG2_9APHY|nr:hypothetical protein PHLCEN_2v8160 [Hermanssonia centrifuga]
MPGRPTTTPAYIMKHGLLKPSTSGNSRSYFRKSNPPTSKFDPRRSVMRHVHFFASHLNPDRRIAAISMPLRNAS